MPKVYNSIIVPARVEAVWSRVCDFHDFSWAPSLVTSCEKIGPGDGYSIGARRLLNGVFLDTLIAYSSIGRRMMYSMDEGPSPVSSSEIQDYVGNLHLLPVTADSTTFVEWSATWESKNADMVGYMDEVYRALLMDLATGFGARRSNQIAKHGGILE